MYREFVAPEDQEIFESVGVWPEIEEGSEASMLTFDESSDGKVEFSYDVHGRSVRLRWTTRDGRQILDLFREGATRLTSHSEKEKIYFLLDYETGECAGKMRIQVLPHPEVTDHLLFQ